MSYQSQQLSVENQEGRLDDIFRKMNTFYCTPRTMSLEKFRSKGRMLAGEWQWRKVQVHTKMSNETKTHS